MLPALLGRIDGSVSLDIARLALPGVTLSQVSLAAAGDAHGVALNRLAADIPGAHLEASGRLAPDGTLAETRLNLDAAEAASLPAAWRALPGLWQGPLHLALTAAGPPRAVAVQLRCDVGDLRAEADGTVDSVTPALTTTATLRHPGAPRLLHQLGIEDAGRWLEQGSVALVAHLSARPGLLEARDFSLAAASLRLNGQGHIDFSGAIPILSAAIDAPRLALPSFDPRGTAPLPFAALGTWQGNLRLAAAQVLFDLRPVATGLAADFLATGGVLHADARIADIAGGAWQGEAALDSAEPLLALRGNLRGAALDALAPLPPWDFAGGTADIAADVSATGHSPAALLATLNGSAAATLHGTAVRGVDLPHLALVLTARGPKLRPALAAAMASGDTGPVSGTVSATLDHGAVNIAAPDLTGAAGRVGLRGVVDLPGGSEDATLRVQPDVPAPPLLGVRLIGAWQSPRRVVDLADALAWAGAGKKDSSFLKKRSKKLLSGAPRSKSP
jgi:hypothetical protein